MLSGIRNSRIVAGAFALAGVVALPVVMMAPSATASTSTVATPADVLTSCTVSISPATFGPTDTLSVTISVTPSPAATILQVDAGPPVADNTSSSITDFPALDFVQLFSFSSGAHTFNISPAGSGGTATGAQLCSAEFTYLGPLAPAFVSTPELPGATVGAAYETSIDFSPGRTYTVLGCTLVGDVPGLAIAAAADIPVALDVADSNSNCGTVSGTPTAPGTYTLTGTISYAETAVPVSILSLDAPAVTALTVTTAFTLVVGDVTPAVPAFTG
jgi:hypothetical protein